MINLINAKKMITIAKNPSNLSVMELATFEDIPNILYIGISTLFTLKKIMGPRRSKNPTWIRKNKNMYRFINERYYMLMTNTIQILNQLENHQYDCTTFNEVIGLNIHDAEYEFYEKTILIKYSSKLVDILSEISEMCNRINLTKEIYTNTQHDNIFSNLFKSIHKHCKSLQKELNKINNEECEGECDECSNAYCDSLFDNEKNISQCDLPYHVRTNRESYENLHGNHLPIIDDLDQLIDKELENNFCQLLEGHCIAIPGTNCTTCKVSKITHFEINMSVYSENYGSKFTICHGLKTNNVSVQITIVDTDIAVSDAIIFVVDENNIIIDILEYLDDCVINIKCTDRDKISQEKSLSV